MSGGSRAGMAGVVGAIVAFGVAELVHGLYPPVPSVFVALGPAGGGADAGRAR